MDLNFLFGLSISLFIAFCVLERAIAQDNFGLLYGSLSTFQAHACDGEDLHLTCTNNTIISINFVRYGRQEKSGHLCPGINTENAKTCHLDSALKVIEERCRGAMECHLQISPQIFFEDPCPGIRKYAEVAYKCKPENFRNKVVCEGQRLFLRCPRQSIVIYSATFGTSKADILECPRIDPIKGEDCLVSYATETVMRLCSRREECSITANIDTFGNPNCAGRKYLKVTYSCVDSKLLVETSVREKSTEEIIHTTSFPAWVRGLDHSVQNNRRFQGFDVKTPTEPSNSGIQSDEAPTEDDDGTKPTNQKFINFLSGWMSAHKYVENNKQKFILYLAVSLSVGVIVFLTVLGVRLFVIRRPRHSSKLDITPDTEDQFFSDSDLEQFDPPEDLPPAPPMTTTLRRHDSDAQPRAPITTGPELNHYFS